MINKRRQHVKPFISIDKALHNKKLLEMSYKTDKRTVNKILGSVAVLVGIITLPLPTGSIVLILLGLSIYACPISIKKLLRHGYEDIKFFIGVRVKYRFI